MRQRNEESDSNCIEALDTQEFTVMPIHKGNGESTTSFKVGSMCGSVTAS